MFFIDPSKGFITDLPTMHNRMFTIDVDYLEKKCEDHLNEWVYLSFSFPNLGTIDNVGVSAPFSTNISSISISLNITMKEFITLLKKQPPRDDKWDREFGHDHVVDILMDVDYDAEKDEGIVSIKCNDRFIHLQSFSIN